METHTRGDRMNDFIFMMVIYDDKVIYSFGRSGKSERTKEGKFTYDILKFPLYVKVYGTVTAKSAQRVREIIRKHIEKTYPDKKAVEE